MQRNDDFNRDIKIVNARGPPKPRDENQQATSPQEKPDIDIDPCRVRRTSLRVQKLDRSEKLAFRAHSGDSSPCALGSQPSGPPNRWATSSSGLR